MLINAETLRIMQLMIVCLVPMQVYKLLYAMRLAECGMFDVSLSYLEAVSKSVLTQRKPVPRAVIKEVYQLAEILLNSDQVMSTTEGDDSEPNNPIWLQRMRDLYSQCYVSFY